MGTAWPRLTGKWTDRTREEEEEETACRKGAMAKQEERDQSPAVCFASAALHTARLADCCYFKQLLWIVPAAAAFRGAG